MNGLVHICVAPTTTVEHNGKSYEFEISFYPGPWPLNRKGEPLAPSTAFRVPKAAWEAAQQEWNARWKK